MWDQEDLYLAYSVLKVYTYLCNTVEYCNKFSIPPYSISQFKKICIYLCVYYIFFIIMPSLGLSPPKMKILESPWLNVCLKGSYDVILRSLFCVFGVTEYVDML